MMMMTMWSAMEPSTISRLFAEAFRYETVSESAFPMSGADYNQTFDRAVNPKACSLREASYTQEDHSALFEELGRFYAFFGLGRSERAELPDHLSVELEFMHYLTHLEAEQAQDPEELESVRRAQADFLRRHLARLVNGVRGSARPSVPACEALVASCHDFIESELALVHAGFVEQE